MLSSVSTKEFLQFLVVFLFAALAVYGVITKKLHLFEVVQTAPKPRDQAILMDDPVNGTVMRYQLKRNDSLVLQAEESFTLSRRLKVDIGFPLNVSGVKPVTKDTFNDFVFVTASSGNHFHEGMDAIAVVQKLFPKHTVFYYDLDTDSAIDKVNKIKQLCNVVYRKFNYDLYPAHVRNLRTFAFKPLLIYDLLHDHKTVIWMDASARFRTANLDGLRDQLLDSSSNFIQFEETGHSIFAATHSETYKYLPISKSSAVQVNQRGPPTYFHCTQELHDGVIRWWVLCALEPKCTYPTTDLYCSFRGRDQYGHCHRHDQSALSILAANYFNDDISRYFLNVSITDLQRGSHNAQQLHVCRSNATVAFLKSGQYF